jgi:uncharacterized protein YndB with AHSA1/START domain
MNSRETPKFGFSIERRFAASARIVFEAWTNPEVMCRWWHAAPHWHTSHAESNLRVGGAVRVVMHSADDGNDYGGRGEYTVIHPYAHLAFTWTWDDEDTTSLIELRFTEIDGATDVVLTHSGLPSADSASGHEEGWRAALDNLQRKVLAS